MAFSNKQYYIQINDQREGPYQAGDLRKMLIEQKVSPETPTQTDGMTSWVPLRQAIYIADAPAQAAAAEAQPAKHAGERTAPVSDQAFGRNISREQAAEKKAAAERKQTPEERFYSEGPPGIGRLSYIITPLIVSLLSAIAFDVLMIDQQSPIVLGYGIGYLLLFAIVWPILRLRNIGYSVWRFLLFLIPLVNIYMHLICVAAPPGYRYEKRMDWIGILLILLMVVPIVLLIAGAIYLAKTNPELLDSWRQAIEQAAQQAQAAQS